MLEEFNKLIFQKIDHFIADIDAKEKGTLCDFSGTIFEGSISFSRYDLNNPLPDIFLRNCQLSGTVDFSKANFSKAAFFLETTFNDDVDFSQAHFTSKAAFIGSKFIGRAVFNGTKFSEAASFVGADFFNEANFTEANFSKPANFQNAKFRIGAIFHKNFFGNGASFELVQFDGFSGIAEGKFNEAVLFGSTQFGGKFLFLQNQFAKRVFFPTSVFNDGEFRDNIFKEGKAFNGVKIKENIRLENEDLKNTCFMNTDLMKIDFVNCKWNIKHGRKLLVDEIHIFEKVTHKDIETKNHLEERFGIFEKLIISLKEIINKLSQKYISYNKEDILKVETLYRRLKQKYKEECNESEIANWHYGEREMFRKSNLFRRYFPLSISNLYWFSSGYGERPTRAGAVLLFLVIIMSYLLGLAGIRSADSGDISRIMEWKDLWNLDYLKTTLEYATFDAKPNFTPCNEFIKIGIKLIIPIQTTLFALAIRNRFRR
ncbi:MAG: pentapeptide repeat-containing protein [Thermodesulfovibrionales bacterium]